MYRPFPAEALRKACGSATRVAVLDRNYAAGSGGIFWQDTRAAFQGHRDDLLVQNYLTGLCGGDVTPKVVDEILADVEQRSAAGEPVWMGIEAGEED
jgi:pyruvate ferredoxin oxidoreductase alpha subunit